MLNIRPRINILNKRFQPGAHAVAVAYVAKLLNMPSVVIMTDAAPSSETWQCSRLGATVTVCASEMEALGLRERLQSHNGMMDIPASHDSHVISGHGTVGLELVKQWRGSNITAVFCNIAYLDLIAGLAVFLKRVSPQIKVIAVELVELTEDGSSELEATINYAQGESFRLCREHVDGIIPIRADELYSAVKDIYEGNTMEFG